MKNLKIATIAMVAIAISSMGCKKSYLETSPSRDITDENLYTTTTSAYQVIDGIARLMNTTGASYESLENPNARSNDFGESAVRLENDCLGQDMVRAGSAIASYDWFYYCSNYVGIRQPSYNVAQLSWRLYFKLINSSNLLLDNIYKVTGPAAEIENLKGQAYAFRAYSYYKASIFYCKTYATVAGVPQSSELGLPLYLHGTTDTTKGHPRSTLVETYAQIVSDLDSARVHLEAGGSISGRPRSDISLPVLYGITAEVALVMHNWTKANEMADLAMSTFGGSLMSQDQYKQGFNSASNPEWMWASNLSASQRQDMGNRNFFSFVDPTNASSYAAIGISTSITKFTLDIMRNMIDVRATTFTGTRQQTKFRLASKDSWTFDLLYMRLAEMYLIKAEALAELGRNDEGIATLETLVKSRNTLYDYSSNLRRYTQANSVGQSDALYFGRTPLLKEIYLQRRIELFMEGFAYADIQRTHSGLKRPTGSGNFSGSKTIAADNVQFLFKIPQQEFDANPAMAGQQNP